MLRVCDRKMKVKRDQGKRRSPSSSGKCGVKVVYISSPMKVSASTSEFRAVVQELTGQDSDVTRFMECAHETDHHRHHQAGNTSLPDFARGEKLQSTDTVYNYGSNDIFLGEHGNYFLENESSPTESDYTVERLDENLFSMPHVERRFRESHFPLVSQELALLDVLN